ncbi:dihydroxyacetone kinase subunit DhaL [Bradyrhizobium sp.]|uniref:dihydroxyacetone kinase subunit DhaL n=1 Tax=Bradyrhizobium sp. TaxID=376 RepID=UPI003C212FC3
MDSIDLEAVKRLLIAAADRVIGHRDALTKADQAIGDGDHGVGMERGFVAARQAILTKPAQTAGDVFKNVGLAVLGQSGGASGAVFGTFFIGAGKPLSQPSLDASGYAAALVAGLEAVRARGKAKPGDKTMVDALAAAIAAVTAAPSQDLCAVAMTAAAGARAGSDATKDMVASTGKAKTLGARSLGHVDPGSITLALVLEGFAEALIA